MTFRKLTQTKIIQELILKKIDDGIFDKQKIYDEVVEELGIPRPTVRRACRDLVKRLKEKVSVLGDDSRISNETKKKIMGIDWHTKK